MLNTSCSLLITGISASIFVRCSVSKTRLLLHSANCQMQYMTICPIPYSGQRFQAVITRLSFTVVVSLVSKLYAKLNYVSSVVVCRLRTTMFYRFQTNLGGGG